LERVASWENLLLAAEKARRGKTCRPDVDAWWLRRETELAHLREQLLQGSWQPGPYRIFTIHEPKRREIAAAPFRDRVLHHALCNLLAPVLERRFIARSFSCQIGKGTTAARDCCRRLTHRHRYVLKCDVRKFFPSLDHDVLLGLLDERVECPGIRLLIRRIVASHATPPDQLQAWHGDRSEYGRPCGVPIGNLTSQIWGNLYLDGFDHWITEEERHGAYIRYTDDFLIFGDDKGVLWELRAAIVDRLASLRLRLAEPKSRLLDTREGVPFCGFRFLPGLQPRILGATKRRFERRRRLLLAANDVRRLGAGVFAWYQFSTEANSLGLRRAYTSPRRPGSRTTAEPPKSWKSPRTGIEAETGRPLSPDVRDRTSTDGWTATAGEAFGRQDGTSTYPRPLPTSAGGDHSPHG
jgi:RNA-directed DNA polymerase